MTIALRCLVWAACLPLLWPPGVCPHHGPLALLTGTHPADDPAEPCCPECSGADQSRLVEPAVALALDLPTVAPPSPVALFVSTPVPCPVPPPDPSPPLYRTLCRLAC